jgi:hypothetical protein
MYSVRLPDIMARFDAGQISVLVCTSAFGEGVDNRLGGLVDREWDRSGYSWRVVYSGFRVSLLDAAEHDQVFPGMSPIPRCSFTILNSVI